MFEKGNKLSKGRPRISLTKPELLLPAVFYKGTINWAADFCRLYRAMRERELTAVEKTHWKALLELMPYLCTKVQLKEIADSPSLNPSDAVANSKQTMELLKALENESDTKESGS